MGGFIQDEGRANWQPAGMVPLSRLPAGDRKLLRQLLGGDALLSFYLALAEAEAARGEYASLVLIGRARRGASARSLVRSAIPWCVRPRRRANTSGSPARQ